MTDTSSPLKPQTKAVGLISGGLDSVLAAKIVSDLGVDVYGLYFSMPWGCCDKDKATQAAQALGIKFMIMQLNERYLEMIKNPKFGYGTALNPCVDCRIHMFSRAKEYMQEIGADFVFTGEVLGQRPMSQMRHSMASIEKHSGLEGRLLRPLCALHLEPTIAEQQNLIDRTKLLDLSGRSRKEQLDLAKRYDIHDFLPPAGGCLLTDDNFAKRMSDTLKFGYRTFRETISLKWGRHFRLSSEFKIILGRDESENKSIKAYAHEDDHILELGNRLGPTSVLKGNNPDPETLMTAAGLMQYFSKYRNEPAIEVDYWPAKQASLVNRIQAKLLTEEQVMSMKI
ncbi:MAG: tRNA 4-thiouridine(8) synthase ThiI [Candidatus Omnitrophota bacterium]